MNNEFMIFGKDFARDFGDIWDHNLSLRFHTVDFKTDEEIKDWYLRCNDGGTVHTKEDLDRVRKLDSVY